MKSSITKAIKYITRTKIFADGSAITAFRTPILAPLEILVAGLSIETSANMRLFGAATNYFATGIAYARGRDYLKNLLKIKDNGEEKNKRFDRIYGLSCACVGLALDYSVYSLLGARTPKEAIVASFCSIFLTSIGGNQTGITIDTFRDGYGLVQDSNRSIFPSNLDSAKKEKIINLLNAASLGGLIAFYLVTR